MNLRDQFNQLDMRKSVTIGLFLAVCYYLLAFNDGSSIDRTMNQLKTQMAGQQNSLNLVKKALADKALFETEIKNIDLNMKDFNRFFNKPMSVIDLSGKVSTFAEENQLVINSLKPIEKAPEFPDYSETVVEFVVEGNFHNIMTFIAKLTQMQKAIDFSNMEFTTVTGGDFPIVKLKTTLVVYGGQDGATSNHSTTEVSTNG